MDKNWAVYIRRDNIYTRGRRRHKGEKKRKRRKDARPEGPST
jgi:hypothetical protein